MALEARIQANLARAQLERATEKFARPERPAEELNGGGGGEDYLAAALEGAQAEAAARHHSEAAMYDYAAASGDSGPKMKLPDDVCWDFFQGPLQSGRSLRLASAATCDLMREAAGV